VYTLSGYLQKPWGDRGAGLTLSLVRKKTGEIIANRTIWQKEFDSAITPPKEKDPAPYYRLAEPAAIWTLFHEVLAFNKKLTPFGTENWLSFAYFRAGVRWTREGRKDKARKLYIDALNRDMNNRSALFNLGALDVEAGEYELAITRLQMARENEPKDLVWYKATYQLAATYHYKSMQDKDEAEKLWRQAESEATKEHCFVCSKQKAIEACRKNDDAENGQNLAESEAKELHKAIKEAINPQKNENKELRKFLESFKPMADIMYAAILVGTNKKGRSKSQKIIDSYSTKHLQETRTREGGRGYKTYSKYDKLNYRDHYNLACYYSVADNNKKAWEHLKYALKRGGEIVQWAQKDPSLEGLREYKECKFDDLIKECSAPVTPSADLLPLAGLKLIGATYAKHLKELGIVSHDDLILKAKNCHAREELAKKLCIDPKFLQRWALLADMMRIVGIETQYANLLEAAGVRSLDDLKVRYSHDLTELLHQVNSAQSLVKQLPLEETVQQWVRDAQKTTKHIASD
jgi:tetratricopeptide (TPR) repeat protein